MNETVLRRPATAFVGALVAIALAAATLAVIVPGLASRSDAQTPPTTCPAGTTLLNGTCSPPGVAPSVCPAGTTLVGGSCTVPPTCPGAQVFFNGACSNAIFFFSPVPAAGCGAPPLFAFDPGTGLACFFIFPTGAAATCPSGTTLSGGACAVPPTCAPGTTLAANGLCFPPGTLPTCAPGETLINQVGLCFPPGGTTGDADASGGDGGSARGGDGGRGGSGTAPQCNQNSNDITWSEWWEDGELVSDAPTVNCGAGGRGGDAGDAGISEGGDGGVAFSTDGFI